MNRHIAQVCLYTNYTEDELLADLHAVQEFEFLAKNNQIEVGECPEGQINRNQTWYFQRMGRDCGKKV